MAAAVSPAIAALRDDLKHEVAILRVKRKVLRILEQLPDDDARRRVVIAATVLLGHEDLLIPRTTRLPYR